MGDRGVGQHHGELKDALIRAALELIEKGEPVPSMRQVARLAGVSPGAPYHHFEGHSGLMAAVAARGFERLHEAVGEARAGAPDARGALHAMVARYHAFAREHRAHYRTMFAPLLEQTPPEPSLEARARAAFAELVGAVAAVRPELSEAQLLTLTRQAWALSHGAVMLALDDTMTRLGGPAGADDAAAEVADATLALVLGFGP